MKNILNIIVLTLLISSCSKLLYKTTTSDSACSDKGGYWYKNKCWKDFDDEGIAVSKIDSTVAADTKIIEKSKITINDETHPLVAFLPIEEDKDVLLITVYGTKDDYKTLLISMGKKTLKSIKKGLYKKGAMLFEGNIIDGEVDMTKPPIATGTANINIIDVDKIDFEINGNLLYISGSSKPSKYAFKSNEAILGAGDSHIEVKGNEAYLSGTLGTITYTQIKNLIKNNPEVKTIVMKTISGSINDAINMHTGRLVHENGFTTKVLSDSDIASGGVDLFAAGTKRIVEKGAKIGVHSWCCVNNLTAIQLPKNHPAHQYQLEYFTMAMGVEKGPSFYFYTLEASPFNDVHYMTDDEIKKWDVSTKFIEK